MPRIGRVLAAQHRFGARTGLSMVMLGSVTLLIGLLFGAAVLAWMQVFQSCILGVFLLVAGAGLAGVSRCWTTRPGLFAAGLAYALARRWRTLTPSSRLCRTVSRCFGAPLPTGGEQPRRRPTMLDGPCYPMTVVARDTRQDR